MITSDGKLEVLENFVVDYTLPKYRQTRSRGMAKGMVFDAVSNAASDDEDEGEMMRSSNVMTMPARLTFGPSGVSVALARPKLFWWARLVAFVLAPFRRRPEPAPTLSIQDFFVSVKNTEAELVHVHHRATGYEEAILNAKKAGQQALVEKLSAGLNAARMEAQLLAIGVPKYIDEANLVRFVKLCPKGLRLDWVRNFTRVIPPAAVGIKERADALGIFDNYVVLHYDPTRKSYAETQAERNARKDPILFGLMKDRRLLYVVADWVDEVCDLTLDQVADTLGAEAIGRVGEHLS